MECAISPVQVVTRPDRAGKHPTNGSLIISIQIRGRREEVFLLTHAQQQVMFTEPEGIGVRTRDKESKPGAKRIKTASWERGVYVYYIRKWCHGSINQREGGVFLRATPHLDGFEEWAAVPLVGNRSPNFPWNHKQLLFKLDHITVTWLRGPGAEAPTLLPIVTTRQPFLTLNPYRYFNVIAASWDTCGWRTLLRGRNLYFSSKISDLSPKGHISLLSESLLIKMGSVLSSPSFPFPHKPRMYGPGLFPFRSQDPTLVPCVAADHKHLGAFLQTEGRHNSKHCDRLSSTLKACFVLRNANAK